MCGYTVELYSLTNHSTQTIDFEARSGQVCGTDDPFCNFGPTAVGADWLEYAVSSSAPMCGGCVQAEEFQNIDTGAWRSTLPRGTQSARNPPRLAGINARTMVNLDSPSLVTPVCSPLRLPNNGELLLDAFPTELSFTASSPVAFFGRYAVLGNPRSAGPFYLERCGSERKLKIADPGSGNSKLILFGGGNRGLELASNRRFMFHPPPGISALGGLNEALVGDSHIFVSAGPHRFGQGIEVWEAKLPKALQGT